MHPGTVFDLFVCGHFHQIQPQLHPFSTCPCLAGRINIVPLGFFFLPNLRDEQPLQTPDNPPPRACCIPIPGPLPGSICRNLMVSNPHLWCVPNLSFLQAGKRGSPRQKSRERKHCVGLKQFLTLFWCFMCSVLSVSCNVCWPLLTDLLFLSAADCC